MTLGVSGKAKGKFPDGGYVQVECRDTGPGIPDHVKSKLFTEDAISTKPMGTGLGTKIIKNVIDAHGGVIELESQVGVGTTIRLRVPGKRSDSLTRMGAHSGSLASSASISSRGT